jgi:hypothetical protein
LSSQSIFRPNMLSKDTIPDALSLFSSLKRTGWWELCAAGRRRYSARIVFRNQSWSVCWDVILCAAKFSYSGRVLLATNRLNRASFTAVSAREQKSINYLSLSLCLSSLSSPPLALLIEREMLLCAQGRFSNYK